MFKKGCVLQPVLRTPRLGHWQEPMPSLGAQWTLSRVSKSTMKSNMNIGKNLVSGVQQCCLCTIKSARTAQVQPSFRANSQRPKPTVKFRSHTRAGRRRHSESKTAQTFTFHAIRINERILSNIWPLIQVFIWFFFKNKSSLQPQTNIQLCLAGGISY